MRILSRALLVCLVLGPGPAMAQERPSAAILATATSDAVDQGLGETFDRALRAEVDTRGTLATRGSVVLDLPDLQLALGCTGESASCLGAVAAEMSVRFLLLPSLDREGAEIVATLGMFDTEAPETVTRAVRRVPADSAGQLLDAIGGVLDELFPELAQPGPEAPGDAQTQLGSGGAVAPAGEPDPQPAPTRVSTAGPDGGRLGAAIGIGVVGAVLIGVGAGFGAASQDNADQYADAPLDTEADAESALARLRDAEDQATVANALLISGGVVFAAGVVWAIVEAASSGDDAPAQARLTPWGSATGGGLVVSGAL